MTLNGFECGTRNCIFGPRDCDDGNECTTDSCSESAGACQHELVPHGNPESQNGADACMNGRDDDCDGYPDSADPDCGGCSIDAHCDDANSCTADTCSNRECNHVPAADATACDDGNACTRSDTCASGVCKGDPWDDDRDGALSNECGGTDCDDKNPEVSPDLFEGPRGNARCSDGLDNDCDQKTDQWDGDCSSPVCIEGWCWTNPHPTSAALEGLWAPASNLVVAVGQIAMHWDGTGFVGKQLPGSPPYYYDVHGTGPSDVWAVGSAGQIARFDGSNWSAFASGTTANLRGVWARTTTDAWAVGAGGKIARWNGSAWLDVPSGVTAQLNDVWGTSATDVWVVGNGPVLRWNGASFVPVAGAPTGTSFYGVWASGPGNVVISSLSKVYRYDGANFVDMGAAGGGEHVSGAGTSSVWVTNHNGPTHQWNGSAWKTHYPPRHGSEDPVAVGVVTANDVWVVGNNGLLDHWDGSAWTAVRDGAAETIKAIARPGADGWAGGADGLLRYNGTRWVAPPDPPRAIDVVDLHASSESNVWIVGESRDMGQIWQWNGSSFTAYEVDLAFGEVFTAVWTNGPNDAWITTDDGKLFRSTGGAPAVQAAPASELYDLAATGSNNVWIAARQSIQKYDGAAWSAMAGPGLIAYQVWAAAPNDVWAAGAFGRIAHWDGASWTPRAAKGGEVDELTGTSASDVWLIEGGLVERWSGSSWVETPSPAAGGWSDLHVSSSELWVTGNGGGILVKKR